MVSAAVQLWPYLLAAGLPIAIGIWLLRRVSKDRPRLRLGEDGVTLLPERRSPDRLEDTQAGRI